MTVTRTVAVVLGGGAGNRFGAATPKQLLSLGGKTLVEYCVTAFASAPGIEEVLLVMPAAYTAEAKKLAGDQVNAIIEGGVGKTSAAMSGMITTAARSAVCTTIESGTVYHDRLPTLIDGSTTSPNMSRGTATLLYGLHYQSGFRQSGFRSTRFRPDFPVEPGISTGSLNRQAQAKAAIIVAEISTSQRAIRERSATSRP